MLFLILLCSLIQEASAQPELVVVKLMSYNIRNGRGMDNMQDLTRIASVIDRIEPDVVALQEVDSMTKRNTRYIAGELGKSTGMHAAFGRAIDFHGGAYGVGLLSRKEPLSICRIPLPGREEARVLLMAEFLDYVICVTHLSLTPEDRNASLQLIREATEAFSKPVLLAGDFNTDKPDVLLEGLGDGFRLLSDATQMTFPADRPEKCIDYIFGRNLPPAAIVTECMADQTTIASDHCPVWITLRW